MFNGRQFTWKGQLYEVTEIHCMDSVWASGSIQYRCEMLPKRPDRQYSDSNAFKCFSMSELMGILKIELPD